MLIDFVALKERINIEQAVAVLGLQMKPEGNQLRGMCPACESEDPRALVVTPSKGLFYCFKAGEGGDLIKLAAHIRNEGIKDAAKFLAEQAGLTGKVPTSTNTSTSTQEPRQPAQPSADPRQPADNKLDKVIARLIHDHEKVQALGLTPELAKSLLIGYVKNGTLGAGVLFPLYKNGELAGFMRYDGTFRFPSNLIEEEKPTAQVIQLPKAG